MKRITFSHKYKKFPPVLSPTFVKGVSVVNYDDLSEEFIKADTETEDGQFYKLPKGKLIHIQLYTEGHEWQTLRSWTKEKEEYYRTFIGEEVSIVISTYRKFYGGR